jgi:hypothetical protein
LFFIFHQVHLKTDFHLHVAKIRKKEKNANNFIKNLYLPYYHLETVD